MKMCCFKIYNSTFGFQYFGAILGNFEILFGPNDAFSRKWY